MTTFAMPPSACPYCGEVQTFARATLDSTESPEPGDISLCADCGEVLRFAQDLTLIRMDRDAWASLPGDVLAQIVAMQNAHAAMKRK